MAISVGLFWLVARAHTQPPKEHVEGLGHGAAVSHVQVPFVHVSVVPLQGPPSPQPHWPWMQVSVEPEHAGPKPHMHFSVMHRSVGPVQSASTQQFVVGMQLPLQTLCPVGHAHRPLVQVAPVGHAFQQSPQLRVSV